MAQVTVNINGRTYRMACADGEQERLLGLAEAFNEHVAELRGNFGEIGDQRLTVMAGIVVTDELSEANRRITALEAEIATLSNSQAALSAGRLEIEGSLAHSLTEAAKRIEALSLKINRNVNN
jgi:cell division protein ZapA